MKIHRNMFKVCYEVFVLKIVRLSFKILGIRKNAIKSTKNRTQTTWNLINMNRNQY